MDIRIRHSRGNGPSHIWLSRDTMRLSPLFNFDGPFRPSQVATHPGRATFVKRLHAGSTRIMEIA